eukprot:jgi/Psemu1/30089/gm1.30089_g
MNIAKSIVNTSPGLGINIDRCSPSFLFTNDRTDNVQPRRNPSLQDVASHDDDENVVDDLGSRPLEDIDSILDGVADGSVINETTTMLDEFCKQPRPDPRRGCGDLTVLMNERQRSVAFSSVRPEDGLLSNRRMRSTMSFGRQGLKEQMVEYFEEIRGENAHDITATNASKSPLPFDPSRKADSSVGTTTMVWTVKPTIENGKTNFWFSTDDGACLVLNERNAMEFLDVVEAVDKKKPARSRGCNTVVEALDQNKPARSGGCNILYQVYKTDLKESRVVKSVDASSLIEDIAGTTMKQSKCTQADLGLSSKSDNIGAEVQSNARSCMDATHSSTIDNEDGDMPRKEPPKFGRRGRNLVKRFARYVNRCRMKRIVRQQVHIAVAKTKK